MSTPKKRRRPGPVGGVRDANRRKRTAALEQAALSLFLARGIEGVTIDDVVAKARVAKGSFYRYFDDKTAVVTALFAPVHEEVAAAFTHADRDLEAAADPQSLVAAYQQLSVRLGAVVVNAPAVVKLYLQEARAPGAGARKPVRRLADLISTRAVAITATAHRRGLLRPFDGRVSALSVVGAVEKLLFAVLDGEEIGDPLAIPSAVISLVLEGLGPR
jgi:AcrR family transcriptional regulator